MLMGITHLCSRITLFPRVRCREFPRTLTRLVARERKALGRNTAGALYFSRAAVAYRANLIVAEIAPVRRRTEER